MTATNTVALLLFSVLLAAGQLLFKLAARQIVGVPVGQLAPVLLSNLPLWIAVFLYGCSTMLWVWILSRVPLTQAYPWVALGAIIVPLAAWFLLGEMVKPIFWLGAALITVGILLTQFGAARYPT
jgi:drug/metabolite transporter (DMT)-like permease